MLSLSVKSVVGKFVREDGIVEHMAQDYGDYVVEARLSQIEILPKIDCTFG